MERASGSKRRRSSRSAPRVFQVLIERDEGGWFVAECPALRACYTQGRTYDEVLRNIRDVIRLCLAELKSRGESIPKSAEIIAVQSVEVPA